MEFFTLYVKQNLKRKIKRFKNREKCLTGLDSWKVTSPGLYGL